MNLWLIEDTKSLGLCIVIVECMIADTTVIDKDILYSVNIYRLTIGRGY